MKPHVIVYVGSDWHFARPALDTWVQESVSMQSAALTVIDDASGHHVGERLQAVVASVKGSQLLRFGHRVGPVRAVNKVLAEGTHRLAVVVGGYALAPTGALPRLLKRLSDSDVALVCPLSWRQAPRQVRLPPGVDWRRYDAWMSRHADAILGPVRSSVVALRLDVLRKLGAFDEAFFSFDAAVMDFSQRLLGAGSPSLLAADVFVHEPFRSPRQGYSNTTMASDREALVRRARRSGSEQMNGCAARANDELRLTLDQHPHHSCPPHGSDSLHFLFVLPTLNPYGGVISVVNLINELVCIGHACTLVSLSGPQRHPHFLHGEAMPMPDWAAIPDKADADYDVLVATSWETVAPVVRISQSHQQARVLYFVQDLEENFYPEDAAEKRAAIRQTYEDIATKIVKTKYLERRLSQLTTGVERIPPGMNLDLFYPRDVSRDPRGTVLAMLRYGHHHRGYDLVLEACSAIHRQRPETRFVFFGSDELPRLDVAFDYINAGRVSPDQLPAVYSQANVFLELSRHHGFGRTGVEAMACGVPCVLSDSGGIREYAVHGVNALICPVGDFVTAASAVTWLLDEPGIASRLNREAMKLVRSRFSERAAAECFLAIAGCARNESKKDLPVHMISQESLTTDYKPQEASSDAAGCDSENEGQSYIRRSKSRRAREEFIRNNPLRRILVNSIPKSGTTWVRTMMASLPGYEEYPREGVSGTLPEQLLGVKPGQVFHGHLTASRMVFDIIDEMNFATIYVYRDLRDAVVSNYFHLSQLNPKAAPPWFSGLDKESLLMGEKLADWCGAARRYPDARHWLKREAIPKVTYEALKADPKCEMRRVLNQLEFRVTDEIISHIVDAASFEKLSGRKIGQEDPAAPQRKGVVGDWRNHFTPANIESFKRVYGDLLIEYGYEQHLDW